ncbi:hypothetical protein LRR74_28645, partial [Klebsiella pneumoniae]|nr:hypothetical protein [Klebsiella pneumoniae]
LKTWSRGKSKPIKNVVGLFLMTTNPKMFRYRHEVVLCFGKHDYCRIPLQNTEPSKTVVSSRFRFALPLQNPTTERLKLSLCDLQVFSCEFDGISVSVKKILSLHLKFRSEMNKTMNLLLSAPYRKQQKQI